MLLCLYLIHKGHLRHQENSEHLLVLLDHFVIDAFDQRHSYQNLSHTSFNKSNLCFCCLLAQAPQVGIASPYLSTSVIAVTLFLACLHRLFKK